MKILKTVTLAALFGLAGVAFAAMPDLTVRVMGQSNIAAGTNQKVATIVLTAAGSDLQIKSLPVVVSGNVSNCTLRDNTGAALDGFSFAQPIRLAAGAVMDIAYTCNVSAGGTANVSVVPGSIVATTNNGAASVGSATVADQSTSVNLGGSTTTPGVPNTGSSDTGSTITPGTPGVPNTGAGGDAATTWLLLGLSALTVIAGTTFLAHMRRA